MVTIFFLIKNEYIKPRIPTPIDIGGVLYSDTSKGGSVGDGIVYSYTAPTTQQLAQDIPEPSSFACLAIGVGILGLMYSFFIKKKNVTN